MSLLRWLERTLPPCFCFAFFPFLFPKILFSPAPDSFCVFARLSHNFIVSPRLKSGLKDDGRHTGEHWRKEVAPGRDLASQPSTTPHRTPRRTPRRNRTRIRDFTCCDHRRQAHPAPNGHDTRLTREGQRPLQTSSRWEDSDLSETLGTSSRPSSGLKLSQMALCTPSCPSSAS